MSDFHIILPARLASSRLKHKLKQVVNGKSILQHTYDRCKQSNAKSITIAADSDELMDLAMSFNAVVVKTSDKHTSGTSRLNEAAQILNLKDIDIIVNVQADEVEIAYENINHVANLLANSGAFCASLYTKITDKTQVVNPNVVKVVVDNDNNALYFSRAPIPFNRDSFDLKAGVVSSEFSCFSHVGIYAYTAKSLGQYVAFDNCELEQIEKLEQLRILFNGKKIKMGEVIAANGVEINTAEDLALFKNIRRL